jgi:hypothetical protein
MTIFKHKDNNTSNQNSDTRKDDIVKRVMWRRKAVNSGVVIDSEEVSDFKTKIDQDLDLLMEDPVETLRWISEKLGSHVPTGHEDIHALFAIRLIVKKHRNNNETVPLEV